MDIYDRIDELLSQKKLKPADVHRATGISTALLTQWKQRKQRPSAEKLALVAGYLGASVDYLLGGGEEGKASATVKKEEKLSIEEEAERILSGLSDTSSLTIMLDGKPATSEAREAFKNAVMVGIEMARRANEGKKGGR